MPPPPREEGRIIIIITMRIQEFLNEHLSLQDRTILRILLRLQKLQKLSTNFWRWDISLATKICEVQNGLCRVTAKYTVYTKSKPGVFFTTALKVDH